MVARDYKDIEINSSDIEKAFCLKIPLNTNGGQFAKAILQNDKSRVDSGRIINEAINQGLSAFCPNMIFSLIVKNFQLAANLYGEKLIRLITGYDPSYIRKNLNVPEFQLELQKKINGAVSNLEFDNLVDSEGTISTDGITLASLILLREELDALQSKGIGDKKSYKKAQYGDKADVRHFRKDDSYKDLALKQSFKLALRRSHPALLTEDLKSFERVDKNNIQIIYAIDASGSMKGEKIAAAKKAGIALAFKAIQNKDEAGLVVFGSDIKFTEKPTKDFRKLLEAITRIRASKQTDFVRMLTKSVELFARRKLTKHLIILTDALPTAGNNPEQEALEAVFKAKAQGIGISLVGINLDNKGKSFAEKLTHLSQGRLYLVRNLEEIDRIVLEDYYATA